MTAALYLVAWRVEATKKGRRAKVPRALLIAAQIFKFALIFALLWLMVYILQVPAGSIASGVTVGVIALVLGFAKPRTAGRV
jgi:small neutral amino acid transporter SnatA (MarC family)